VRNARETNLRTRLDVAGFADGDLDARHLRVIQAFE